MVVSKMLPFVRVCICFCYIFYCCVAKTAGNVQTPVVPKCRTPNPPTNGRVNVWGGGLLVEFTCNAGLFPIGQTFGSCDSETNTWSIGRPLCVYCSRSLRNRIKSSGYFFRSCISGVSASNCERPPLVTNGRLYFQHNGSVVIAKCNRGYRLVGSRKSHCDGHSWGRLRPRCRAKYPPVEAEKRQAYDLNVTTTVAPEKVVGDKLEDHVLDSDNTCYLRFTQPPTVEHAEVKIEYEFNHVRRQWVLIANYTCESGYGLVDKLSRYIYCKEYKWKIWKTLPKCVEGASLKGPCDANNGRCDHICVPHTGNAAYSCDCRPGFALGRDRRKCLEIDECELENGGCEQYCQNIDGSYFCTCDRGYITSGRKCIDVDDCLTPGAHRCPGKCVNTRGGYLCDCTNVTGYIQSADGRTCVDVDECKIRNGDCEGGCVNTIGSYFCKCSKKGYRLAKDGITCEDVDECERYKGKRCKHGTCNNTEGSYKCNCHAGFEENHSGKKCLDMDECSIENGGCQDVCVNTVGTYTCACAAYGYTGANDHNKCHDIDECTIDNGGCDDQCVNTDGSYTCVCTGDMMKLSEDGHNCTYCDRFQIYDNETDTCLQCPNNSVVQTSAVGATTQLNDCICVQGYTSNSNTRPECVDIDECTKGLLICDHHCNNTPGSAFCSCFDGYQLHNISNCLDLNECADGSNTCTQMCSNTEGSYVCTCAIGYVLANDGATCFDMDECFDGILTCSQECVNTEGGAYCDCMRGYRLAEDNVTCSDIDECSTGDHVCADKCVNTHGSYLCECEGYGLKLSWDLASCSDVNECMEGDNNCTNSECINTYGSYTCNCSNDGYVLSADGVACEDVDECVDHTVNTCDQLCINIDGTFTCGCRLGYTLTDATNCAECPKDFYRDSSTVECIACPLHSHTEGIGSTTISSCVCQEGYYGNVTNGDECKVQIFGN